MVKSRSPRPPRERILDVASKAFAEKGFAGARVDEIARRARLNKALLYYHVGNKQKIYSSVVERVIAGASERLGRVLDQVDDPEQRIRAMTREIARFAAENPHLPAILLREFASGGGNLEDSVLLRVAALLQKIAAVYREGAERKVLRPFDPVMAHMMTVSTLMLLVGSRPLRQRLARLAGIQPYREPATEDLAAGYADILLDGVRARGKRSA